MSTVYVTFAAPITPQTMDGLLAVVVAQMNAGAKKIYLVFSTLGGSVSAGMVAYSTLRSLPIDLTTHNVGNVESIGNVVFLAGRHRYVSPFATFMFHGAALEAAGGARLEQRWLEEKLSFIKAENTRMAELIAKESALPRERVNRFFVDAETMDAQSAVTAGIAHEVRELTIPEGANVITMTQGR